MAKPALYPAAVAAVEQWLDTDGAAHARRTAIRDSEVAAWLLPANDEGWPDVRVGLPAEFPAVPPTVSLPRTEHLQKPHVEVDGRVCHGVAENAAGAEFLRDVLQQVRYVVSKSEDPDWRELEFHRERASYWIWFCRQRKRRLGALRTDSVRLVDDGLSGLASVVAFGRDAYVGSSLSSLQAFAKRHAYSCGTERHGVALVVQLPGELTWSPSTWPRDWPSVVALIDSCGRLADFEAWSERLARERSSLALIVFRIAGTFFAYQVFPGPVPRLQQPSVEPVHTERRDAFWCLARDHKAQELAERLQKRVVVLGCGSLGSHVASHLARAGVGRIDLVDNQTFEAENVSRHVLGMGDIGQPKAEALAARLRREVPSVDAQGHSHDAVSWLRRQDLSDMALIVDATGDQGVRLGVRQAAADTPSVIAWAEPRCAAAHVVVLPRAELWPMEDPADAHINAYDWTESSEVKLPACGAGFHPYADADMAQVAGMCAEVCLQALNNAAMAAHVITQVHASASAGAIGPCRLPVPPGVQSVRLRREWGDVLG